MRIQRRLGAGALLSPDEVEARAHGYRQIERKHTPQHRSHKQQIAVGYEYRQKPVEAALRAADGHLEQNAPEEAWTTKVWNSLEKN